MKKIIYSLLLGGVFLATSCEKFTDLQPKGKNLLSTTNELEMLLNTEFTPSSTNIRMMAGDMIYTFDNVPTMLSNPNKTQKSIMISWDEANMDKLAELTSSDYDYTDYYGYIGKIANPILACVEAASGDEKIKAQLKCEALVIRAYFHWLLVNKFAKAYNPATAATDPGVPYVLEDWDIQQPTEKKAVQEVYDNILKDLEEAIKIDALPNTAVNQMRMSKACAYATKAFVLMNMQKFDEAKDAAQKALAINGAIMDYNKNTRILTGSVIGGKYPVILRSKLKCEEDYFFTSATEFYNAITTEAWDFFEPGHACKEKMATDRLMYDNQPGMGMGLRNIGLDYTYTYDMESGWNQAGLKSTYMYLIIAECEIHKGNYDGAMEILDKLRVNRIDPSIYAPLKGTVNNEADAVLWLKKTSHGECIYSIYSFLQKKRWNELDKFKQDWTKEIEGTIYKITPNSPLWIFPFPMNAVNNNPNLLPQNYK